MTQLAEKGRSLALRAVLRLDRMVTWGMDPQLRADTLMEQSADWVAMSRDDPPPSGWRILARQLRGLPLAIWWRLVRGEVTALPAAVALAIVALGTFVTGLVTNYPLDHRVSLLMAGCGLALVARRLIERPRTVEAARLRFGSVLLAVGAPAAALTMPGPEDLAYQGAELETPLLDLVMQIGILFIGLGFLVLFVGSFAGRPRRVVLTAGALVVGGSWLLAGTEIAWGIWVASTDLLLTAVALVIALGASLFSHLVLRLRHLEIV